MERRPLENMPDARPDDGDMIPINCEHCDAEITIKAGALRAFPGPTSCHACIEKYNMKHIHGGMKKTWLRICPKQFRETDLEHAEFNRSDHQKLDAFPIMTSMLLVGPSGTCKTRSMFRRLRTAILDGRSVFVVYPEDIKEQARNRFRKDTLDFWNRHDIVAIDDLFEVGTSEAVIDLVMDVINRRIRNDQTTICTSMLSSEEVRGNQEKFGNVSQAEKARLNKLFKRLSDNFQIVRFDIQPDQVQPEEDLF